MTRRQGWTSALFLSVCIALFFWDMWLKGTGYFYGDYGAQSFPWFMELASRLREWELPFWTSKIGCGFPLLAEGQVGALHPFKWLFAGVFPPVWGYHASFWVLFWISGWFSQRFMMRLGVSPAAGLVTAVVFLFGSAYSGLVWGYASLWVMSALPWLMDRAEALAQKPRFSNMAWMSLVAAWLWLGGIAQIALYAVSFALLYLFFRRPRVLGWGLAAVALSILLAAPQLLPTLELAALSARAGQSVDFALQMSLRPYNFFMLLAPNLGFLGVDLYIGLFALAWGVYAVVTAFRISAVRALTLATLTVFLLALGKWNPIYAWLIEELRMTAVRAPSKWILPGMFGLAALAGWGWHMWHKDSEPRAARRGIVMLGIPLAAATAIIGAHVLARQAAPSIRDWGKRFVESEIVGKAGHLQTAEHYLARIDNYMGSLVRQTRWDNYYVLCVLIAAAAFLMWYGLHRFARLRKNVLPAAGLLLMVGELFAYSFVGSGFMGNRVEAEAVAPDTLTARIRSQDGQGSYRTYTWIADPLAPPKWIANRTMPANIDVVGIYTPLVTRRMAGVLSPLGAVDDSTGIVPITEDALTRRLDLLQELNTRFLISRPALDLMDDWAMIGRFGHDHLYESAQYRPRAYYIDKNGEIPGEHPRIITRGGGFYRIGTRNPESRTITVSEYAIESKGAWASGWQGRIDGVRQPLKNLEEPWLAMDLPPGDHEVIFEYVPRRFWLGFVLSVMTGSVLCAAGLMVFKKRLKELKV